ncbi:predicted protein [Uncinocarpus reesii 1704]|uniref:Nucleoporin Nup159/Nup146 N-terminal domain-containing protein n=1 Tax=Uncinocarpus reesii (strain UAMH 1704) TaxID=336963 RepID=C4JFK3_UNCRE|nr:uncharacterized protein UREG_01017 [Uncinocarpus reesii 1704]EEP76168.1 predicted protein [Uncinocarpus reesii 1704]
MAFSFGGASQPGMGAGKVQLGAELQEIQTQEVGFLSLNGDSKVRLLPSPWPADNLPPPTSSLLSVASSKSLLAAAGPDGIVIASTDSVRKAFFADATGDSYIRPFQPELQVPLPGRISHVAFSADETALVVADQNGGGLAVYDVAALMQGKGQPAATISLNGESLRALLPNPVVSELFAAVTTNGELLIANLKENRLEIGPNGPVLKTGVSSVSWSTRGKQLVAGLADGTAYQMTPKGEGKADIPRPPDLEGNQHDEMPISSYYILTRHPPDNYEFRRLPEVCSPFGAKRYPPFQFTGRLKDFEPNLREVLFISSTASTDVGLLTRSTKPLVDDCPPENITDIFTATTMSEDSRRAEVPMTEDMVDTSPVGLAVDLSSKSNVSSPIPGDDLRESSTPLPALMILNNDGVLSSWWFVYSESIRQQKPYPGLSAAAKTQPTSQQPAAPQPSTVPETPKPSFGGGLLRQPAFGQPSFGTPATPTFGSSTPLGANLQQTLGSSQPAFGQSSQLGSGRSLFGQTPVQAPSQFPTGGGFGSFASPGGFGGTIGPQTPEKSVFAKATSDNSFLNAGQPAFGAQMSFTPKETPGPASGAFGSGGFVLGSTFTPDANAAMDEDKPEKSNGALSFGSFQKSLDLHGDAESSIKPESKRSPFSSAFSNIPETETPVSKESAFSTPKTGLFGTPPQFSTLRASVEPTTPSTPSIQPPSVAVSKESIAPSTTPEDSDSSKTTVKVAAAADSEPTTPPKFTEPPLPPDPTSRAAYGPGDTSASSSNDSRTSAEEAPLPPDFLPVMKKQEPLPEAELSEEPSSPKESVLPGSPKRTPPALPDESEEEKEKAEDFEDSGEEVTPAVSPIDFKVSPESSFGGVSDKSPTGGLFTKITAPEPKHAVSKPLFGEILETPVFPPPKLPKGRAVLSPRSPSPVRHQHGTMFSAPDYMRSTSAPIPGNALSRRKAALESSMLANQVTMASEDIEDEIPPKDFQLQTQRLQIETQELVEDEDEQLRGDLARPLSPAPTLDPFLPHQDYTGESLKPGIPGQIERLYRDINAMIDEKLLLSEMEKLQRGVEALDQFLQEGKIENIQEKLEKCHQLFSKDLNNLRGQCASMRKTLDSYTDAAAIASAPLTAEQSALQQDLRKLSTEFQAKLADLEKDVSLLRAKLADCSKSIGGSGGSSKKSNQHTAKPTVEAVTSTIKTMTNMAQQKSGDIDVLEAQMRKLGIDISASVAPQSRETSPFSTPLKKIQRLPITPGSRASGDGGVHSLYHTPESNRTSKFRSSVLVQSALRSPKGVTELVLPGDSERLKAKAQRRREVVGHLKAALSHRRSKVRGLDDF